MALAAHINFRTFKNFKFFSIIHTKCLDTIAGSMQCVGFIQSCFGVFHFVTLGCHDEFDFFIHFLNQRKIIFINLVFGIHRVFNLVALRFNCLTDGKSLKTADHVQRKGLVVSKEHDCFVPEIF